MKYQDITVLLVDGDEYHASMFKNYLRRKGVDSSVKHFSNSFTVERYLFNKDEVYRDKCYLMLLDLGMPGLDIKSFSKKINEKYKSSNLITIGLSESMLNNSMNEYCQIMLSKPLVQNSFEEKLSQLGIIVQNSRISCTKKLVKFVS